MIVRALIICIILLLVPHSSSKYSSWAKKKLDDSFNSKCGKYPWVRNYLMRSNSSSQDGGRYAVFVFDDQHTRARKGGLGDRLGGLITSFAFALRSNRTFLIQSQSMGLGRLFQPHGVTHDTNTSERSWSDLSWSGFNDRIPHFNKTYLWCVNPKPSQTFCALDDSQSFAQYNIVRLRINRSYLCRWAENNQLLAHPEMRELLGITKDSDLFEIGGCMLRLALYPTEHLWKELDIIFDSTPSYQIGFHYRCGDHNYKGAHLHPELTNHMQCTVEPGVPWNGTHAVDELSLASPVDSANCGKSILSSLTPTQRQNALAYVASDSPESAKQIADTLQWRKTSIAPPGCHIDFDPSPECSYTTLLYWFILTLNDVSVYQSYLDRDINAQLASSSFSRYAMIYSLKGGEGLRFAGPQCDAGSSGSTSDSSIWNSSLSRQPQGNWVCTGGTIY